MKRLKEITEGWTWPDYGVMTLLLSFTLYNRLMPMLFILTSLSLIIYRRERRDIRELISPKYPFTWFIAFFLVHGIGVLYSRDTYSGIEDVGMKLSLLAFPLFFLFTRLKLKLEDVLNGYLVGLFITCIVCFVYAGWRSCYHPEDNQWAYFKGSYFSFVMHRSYFATYLALGVLIAVKQLFSFDRKRWIYIGLILLFGSSTVLTFSKAGILIMMVLFIPLGYYLFSKYYDRWVGLAVVGGVLIGVLFVINTNDKLKARFIKMGEVLTANQTVNNVSVESSASRLIMWSTSVSLILENPFFGVGTGDVTDALNERNKKLGNTGVVEKSLNSHNQYLNTGVQLGLLGLVPLLIVFGTSLWLGIKRRKILLILVVCTFMLTLLFESFLETQAGVMPVTFLTLLFTLKTIE